MATLSAIVYPVTFWTAEGGTKMSQIAIMHGKLYDRRECRTAKDCQAFFDEVRTALIAKGESFALSCSLHKHDRSPNGYSKLRLKCEFDAAE